MNWLVEKPALTITIIASVVGVLLLIVATGPPLFNWGAMSARLDAVEFKLKGAGAEFFKGGRFRQEDGIALGKMLTEVRTRQDIIASGVAQVRELIIKVDARMASLEGAVLYRYDAMRDDLEEHEKVDAHGNVNERLWRLENKTGLEPGRPP